MSEVAYLVLALVVFCTTLSGAVRLPAIVRSFLTPDIGCYLDQPLIRDGVVLQKFMLDLR